MRRTLVVFATVVALAAPAVIGTSSPASASSGVVCSKVGGTTAAFFTINRCTPKDAQHKSAMGLSQVLMFGGAFSWRPALDNTIISAPTVSSPGQGACKRGYVEQDIVASVIGGTSTYTQTGDVVTGSLCRKADGIKLKLVKGSTLTL